MSDHKSSKCFIDLLILKTSNAVTTATATWYSDIPLQSSATQQAEKHFYRHYAA